MNKSANSYKKTFNYISRANLAIKMPSGFCSFCSQHWNVLVGNFGNNELGNNLLEIFTKSTGYLALISYAFIQGPAFIPISTLAPVFKTAVNKYTYKNF